MTGRKIWGEVPEAVRLGARPLGAYTSPRTLENEGRAVLARVVGNLGRRCRQCGGELTATANLCPACGTWNPSQDAA